MIGCVYLRWSDIVVETLQQCMCSTHLHNHTIELLFIRRAHSLACTTATTVAFAYINDEAIATRSYQRLTKLKHDDSDDTMLIIGRLADVHEPLEQCRTQTGVLIASSTVCLPLLLLLPLALPC